MKCGLLPLSQESALIGDVSYHRCFYHYYGDFDYDDDNCDDMTKPTSVMTAITRTMMMRAMMLMRVMMVMMVMMMIGWLEVHCKAVD